MFSDTIKSSVYTEPISPVWSQSVYNLLYRLLYMPELLYIIYCCNNYVKVHFLVALFFDSVNKVIRGGGGGKGGVFVNSLYAGMSGLIADLQA